MDKATQINNKSSVSASMPCSAGFISIIEDGDYIMEGIMREFFDIENKAINDAYHYINNVSLKQGRFLSDKDMYQGYVSMGFKPEFTFKTFKLVYEGFKETIAENQLKTLEGTKTLKEVFGL